MKNEKNNNEVKGTPSDVAEALRLGIISEKESKVVLKQMEERGKRKANETRKKFGLPPK
jgi:hypothetical protein